MRFLSVCSGIEAASVAWNPLGWSAAAFAEIEKFPSAVLAHHYPDVPNLGDMTRFQEWPDIGPIDLLCGGTPCQSFSVAGLRGGLDDPRGNLMLTFGAIAAKHRPRWLVWENVPGVLSSNGGRDFGAFLGLLGIIGYGFSYRVLDAQYFGLAQRRKRVFVVGRLGDWRSAAAVLFERHSLSGHPAPSREAGQGAAAGVIKGAAIGRKPEAGPQFTMTTNEVHAVAFSCKDYGADASNDLAPTLRAMNHSGSHANAGGQMAVAFQGRGSNIDLGQDVFGTIGTNEDRASGGAPCVAFDARQSDVIQYGDMSGPLDTNASTIGLQTGAAVRRLLPVECEKLMGFPRNYTLIPYRGKPAPDGPRYRALGNSWAVPVVSWIGQRIEAVEATHRERDAA